MIKDFEQIVNEGIELKDVSYFGKRVKELMTKYSISEKTVYTRFKSVYKVSPRQYISERVIPSKEELTDYVLSSSSSKEVREKSGLSARQFSGLYDKYFGVSTFQKARLVLLNRSTKVFNPVREDNRAIVYSQVLGDGWYDSKRHALRIIHGERQAGYLRWKVDLLNSAYPKTSTSVKERVHAQGHKYFDYYTPLGNLDIPNEVDCVPLLTNLGWLLWWLDDGSYCQNITICCKRSEAVRLAAIEELKTYGISAREGGTEIIMSGQENDLLFYLNFIKPFINEIPTCMKYKVEDIVGKVVI